MNILNKKGFGIIPAILVIAVISASIGVTYTFIKNRQVARIVEDGAAVVITNFDECVKAGNPVMESSPEQCIHGDKTFTNTKAIHTIANEGLYFVYKPADWPKIEPYENSTDGQKSAGISLTSDVFHVGFAFGQDGKGGFTCFDISEYNPETCKSESKVIQTIPLNEKPVNIVAHMHKEPDSDASYALYLTDKSQCKDAFSCSFPAKHEAFKNNSAVTASYSDDRTFKSIEEFVLQPEVKRAIEIFTSVEY